MIKTLPYRFKIPETRAHVQWFFRYIVSGVIPIFIFLSGQNYAFAQVQVTGHVFAEIVEPTALSSKSFNTHLIEVNSTAGNNKLVLARVNLSGGHNINVDIAIKSSQLVASNGDIIPFDAIVCPICTEENINIFTGEKGFILEATPGESILPKRNITYSGGYSLVFLYN